MNIGRLIEDNIKRFGEYDFICHEDRWYTNVTINKQVNRLGNALKKLGIKKGDRVGVQLPNCPELVQTFYATFKIGGILVPLNPALKTEDLSYIYRDAGLAALISAPDYWETIKQAREGAQELKYVIMVGENIPAGTLALKEITALASEELSLEETDNDDTAVMIYTAGTTGVPKGVMLTHYNWYSHVSGYYETVLLDAWGVRVKAMVNGKETEVFGIDRNRVSLITLPLFHGYGVFALNLEFLTGGKLVLVPRWNPEEAMACIEKYKVTDFRGVPTMYIQILNHPAAPKYDLSSLKMCICGAAPMPLEVARLWKERYGVDIWEGYGLSEATTVNCGNAAENRPPKYGSIGKCYQKANTIQILDDDGNILPPGQVGEICIKGPAVMKGYWNKPKETAEAIRDGWLHTGDVGYMDEDGYLYITDRKKDLIIRGGENIYPKEIENILHTHPAVLEAGVVGMPDPVYGEAVKAFVVLKTPGAVTVEELMDFCREKLPAYKRPKVIRILDALPKSAVGKILRRELRNID
ncbi:MAG TPA: long-chain fatty acid--CoA ligase [Syntrophales bacterium]|nr:long-chain fatty acid--CoA ligase [Syntrophales bacterium]HOL59375.1 long-chain fatty acid--CoA ligase [Syntrophales bacterium]HPO35532.1 long-chain fatty acid--CoA ligase [Syntrophales bacterium]